MEGDTTIIFDRFELKINYMKINNILAVLLVRELLKIPCHGFLADSGRLVVSRLTQVNIIFGNMRGIGS